MNRFLKVLFAPAAVFVLGGYYYPPEPPTTTPAKVTATLNAVVIGFGAGNFTLKKAGKTFKSLKAGTYKIIVDDRSTIHNFHLTGPGRVNRSTTLADKKKVTWTVTLRKGTYNFVCDPHSGVMKGSFKVF